MHDRVRAATCALHQRVEAAVAISLRLSCLERYKALLLELLGLYRPIEAALAGLDREPPELQIPARRKTPWLEADLRDLGLPDPSMRLASWLALPPLPDRASALGWLYVTEGASLGGRVILRTASRRLGVEPGCGGRFFAGYGPQTADMWRAFLAELNRVEPQSRDADRVEAAAVQMFVTFERWLAGPLTQTACETA